MMGLARICGALSNITQQAVQRVAGHGVLPSCTCFSQLVAYKAE